MALIRKLLIAAALCKATSLYAVIKEPILQTWLRLDGSVGNLRTSPKGTYLAFTDANGQSLRVLHVPTKKVLLVTKNTVGQAFFWAPDGVRLFYRELFKTKGKSVESAIRAFDTAKLANISIESFPSVTGLLSFDPRDLRMHFLTDKGVHTQRLIFPDERLARWQVAQRTEHGKWIAAQNGILWATDGGFTLKRMEDDKTPVQSFDISPDGQTVAWATEGGEVYTSTNGAPSQLLAYGQDPRWHPYKPYLLFSAARRVGNKVASYDLKIADMKGSGKFLTSSQGISERWPTWDPDGQFIYFTKDNSTDLFKLAFEAL